MSKFFSSLLSIMPISHLCPAQLTDDLPTTRPKHLNSDAQMRSSSKNRRPGVASRVRSSRRRPSRASNRPSRPSGLVRNMRLQLWFSFR